MGPRTNENDIIAVSVLQSVQHVHLKGEELEGCGPRVLGKAQRVEFENGRQVVILEAPVDVVLLQEVLPHEMHPEHFREVFGPLPGVGGAHKIQFFASKALSYLIRFRPLSRPAVQ